MVNIIKNSNQEWHCVDCDSIHYCHCDPDYSEPICDCGELGYSCICNDFCLACGKELDKGGLCEYCDYIDDYEYHEEDDYYEYSK